MGFLVVTLSCFILLWIAGGGRAAAAVAAASSLCARSSAEGNYRQRRPRPHYRLSLRVSLSYVRGVEGKGEGEFDMYVDSQICANM